MRGSAQTENISDRDGKERQAKEEGNGRSKLTPDDVRMIHRRYEDETGLSYRDPAREYGVDRATIGAVIRDPTGLLPVARL